MINKISPPSILREPKVTSAENNPGGAGGGGQNAYEAPPEKQKNKPHLRVVENLSEEQEEAIRHVVANEIGMAHVIQEFLESHQNKDDEPNPHGEPADYLNDASSSKGMLVNKKA